MTAEIIKYELGDVDLVSGETLKHKVLVAKTWGFERFSGLQSHVTQFVFDDLFRHFLLSTSIESEITGITTA
jgi:hypothetical protein